MEVWIKWHPFIKSERALEMAGLREENLRFQIKQESVESLLPKVKVVLAGETSVALEALVFGAKAILLNIPEMINMSPLRGECSDLIRSINSPEELRQKVIDIFKEDYNPEKHATEARRVINNFFYLVPDLDRPHRFLRLLDDGTV